MLACLPPLLAPDTRLIILGSFPGAASLRAQQYYAHPQNRFWRLLVAVLEPRAGPAQVEALVAAPYAARTAWMLGRGIGLWDVYAACEREGSLDTDIRDGTRNDLSSLTGYCPRLAAIAHNGGRSFSHARHTRLLGLPVYRLPSSSPANASWSFERKRAAWADVLGSVPGLVPGLAPEVPPDTHNGAGYNA